MTLALTQAELDRLAQGIVARQRRDIARALRWVDDEPAVGRELAALLHARHTGAQVVGVTGNPGAGKSTIVDSMISELRRQGRTVGVLAVDPSSPFSGGAILGDRIRMSRHATDDGVFIRSFATRGALGGLSRAVFDATRVLDAAGFDVIVVETVGVGQDEVDIARLAHTTVVVVVPGLGDDVQAFKAGLLEIADLFLVNKADRPDVEDVERSLKQLLALAPVQGGWDTPILRSVASRGEGIPELVTTIDQHRAYMAGPAGAKRSAEQARDIFDRLLDAALVETGRRNLGPRVDEARRLVGEGGADAYVEIMALLKQKTPGTQP